MSTLEALMLVGVCFGIPGIFIWLYYKEKDFLKIYFSARRMGLRDKGKVELRQGIVYTCTACRTRIRIGIQKNKGPAYYCWRCELIFPEDNDDNSGGGGHSGGGETPPDPPEEVVPQEVINASDEIFQSLRKTTSVD